MAANNMQVKTESINDAISTIRNQALNFKDAYTRVITQFNNINKAWDGDDNQTFQENFDSFKKDFLDMDTFFEKLIDFLTNAINEYQRVEKEQQGKARTLKKSK